MNMTIDLVVFFAVIICFFCVFDKAQAISVGPSAIEVEVSPGEITSTNLRIYNASGMDVLVKVSSKPWVLSANDMVLETEEKTEWITMNQTEFLLKPKEDSLKSVEFRAPKDFVGEKRVYLYFQELTSDSAIATRIAIPVYMMSDKDKKIDVSIKDFSAGYSIDPGEILTTIVFKNKGNVHVRPDVKMRLKNMNDGKYIIDGSGNDAFLIAKDWPVFPEADRTLHKTIKINDLVKHGKYQVELLVNYFYLFRIIDSKTQYFEVAL